MFLYVGQLLLIIHNCYSYFLQVFLTLFMNGMISPRNVPLKALPAAGPPEMYHMDSLQMISGYRTGDIKLNSFGIRDPCSWGDVKLSHWDVSSHPTAIPSIQLKETAINIPVGVDRTSKTPEKSKTNFFVVMMLLWIFINITTATAAGLSNSWSVETSTFGLSLFNFITAIITRNEYFANFLMWTLVRTTRRELYHRLTHNTGGIHAAAGMCCLGWCLASVISGVVEEEFTILSVEWCLRTSSIICLLVMACTGMKFLRLTHHNLFDYVHRILPWILLILFLSDCVVMSRSLTSKIIFISLCGVGFTAQITSSLTMVKLDANAHLLTKFNTRLAVVELPLIAYPGPGKLIKLSRDRKEWHTFAICPNIYGRVGSMCLVAAAGDWTEKLVQSCTDASSLFSFYSKKPIPSYMYSSRAFSGVACIGTGAGIAPSLALFGQSHVRKIIWINNMTQPVDPISTFAVKSGTPYTSFDTSKKRPSVKEIMNEIPSGVEAIFVMANPTFTTEIKMYCNNLNIVCFGSNWDH